MLTETQQINFVSEKVAQESMAVGASETKQFYEAEEDIKKRLKLKKAEKIRFIQMHIATTFGVHMNNPDHEGIATNEPEIDLLEATEDKTDSSEECDESGDDIVLGDTHFSDASSDDSNNEDQDCWPEESFDAASLFTKTRSGQIATNRKAAEYVSNLQIKLIFRYSRNHNF